MGHNPDLKQLKLVMARDGISFEQLAKTTGISEDRLIALVEGKAEWMVSDVCLVSDALKLSGERKKEIFFA